MHNFALINQLFKFLSIKSMKFIKTVSFSFFYCSWLMKYKKFTKTYLKSVLMSFFKIILQFYNGMECKHPNKDYLFAENDRVSLRKTVFLQKIWPQTAWNQSDCGILLFVIWQTDLNGYTFLQRRETQDGRQDCYRNHDCFLQKVLSECHELDRRG